MINLEGKVAIVVGAGSGIGRATAKRLSVQGARVVVADINDTGAAAVVDEIRAAGATAMALHVDVADPTSVKELVDASVVAYGRLDIIHNNAALLGNEVMFRDSGVVDLTPELWDEVMTVNARGAMLGCKYAIPEMLKGGGGVIVNTSSTNAVRGDRVRTAYGCSKAAVIALTQYVAATYGKQNIRCNAIIPGMTVTEYIKSFRPADELAEMSERFYLTPELGSPEDAANAVAFLCSDEARYITGHALPVDGGFLSRLPTHGFEPAGRFGNA